MKFSILLAAVALAIPGAGLAQQQPTAPAAPAAPAAPPCSGPEYRTLDFWVGEWVAEWDNPNGSKGTGTNRITRNEHGSCVIAERYRSDDGTLEGFSVSTYRPGLKQWRQKWVDAQGGYFDLVGGPAAAPITLLFENKRVSETQAFQRMIFQDVKPDSFTWRWQKPAKAGIPGPTIGSFAIGERAKRRVPDPDAPRRETCPCCRDCRRTNRPLGVFGGSQPDPT